MFDKQPEDIFAGTEKTTDSAPAGNQSQAGNNPVIPQTPGTASSPSREPMQPNQAAQPAQSPQGGQSLSPSSPSEILGGDPEPPQGRGKGFLIIIAVVVVLVLGIGGYFAWMQITKPSVGVIEGNSLINDIPEVNDQERPPESTSNTTDLYTGEEVMMPEEEEALEVDTDMDGLIDDEELSLGTNPMRVDSDNDGLTDREEVEIYNTDPLDPDTDGDTYSDGEEVRNGYNPNGDGKLLRLPGESSMEEKDSKTILLKDEKYGIQFYLSLETEECVDYYTMRKMSPQEIEEEEGPEVGEESPVMYYYYVYTPEVRGRETWDNRFYPFILYDEEDRENFFNTHSNERKLEPKDVIELDSGLFIGSLYYPQDPRMDIPEGCSVEVEKL